MADSDEDNVARATRETSGTNVMGLGSSRSTITTTGYGPRGQFINLDKPIKIPFGKEDIFVDFKHQFVAALEGKRLKKFITDKNYNRGLPEDDDERLHQVYVYNCIASSLRAGGRFPVIRDVQDCNAYEAWQKVIERFEGQTAVTSMSIKAQVWGRKLKEGESLTQLCDWLTERFQMLSTTPEKMGEVDKKLVLVMAIEKHPRYERIAATIRHDASILTFNEAVDLVRDEVRYLDVLHADEKLSSNINAMEQHATGTGGGASTGDEKASKKLNKFERRRDKQRKNRGRSHSRQRGGRGFRPRSKGRRHRDRDDTSEEDDGEDEHKNDDGRCFQCGRKGHFIRDCWYANDNDKGKRNGREKRDGKEKEVGTVARRLMKVDLNCLSREPVSRNLWEETVLNDQCVSGDEFTRTLVDHLDSRNLVDAPLSYDQMAEIMSDNFEIFVGEDYLPYCEETIFDDYLDDGLSENVISSLKREREGRQNKHVSFADENHTSPNLPAEKDVAGVSSEETKFSKSSYTALIDSGASAHAVPSNSLLDNSKTSHENEAPFYTASGDKLKVTHVGNIGNINEIACLLART